MSKKTIADIQIKDIFKEIGNFIKINKHINQSFNLYYNLDTKIYFKVYKKQDLIKEICNYPNIERQVLFKKILYMHRKKRYNFLPELFYENEEYLFFKYYVDYNTCKTSDFIDIKIDKLHELVGIKNEKKDFKLTPMFDDVLKKFKDLYIFEKLYEPIPDNMLNFITTLSNNTPKSKELNYITITPSNLWVKDFIVKRDKNSKVLDWKFVDIDNLDILPPRYVYNLDETGKYPIDYIDPNFIKSDDYKRGGHDVMTFNEMNRLTDDANVMYNYNKKWNFYKNIAQI